MQNIDPNTIYERFIVAGKKWAELDGIASKHEEMKKSFRSQLMNSFSEAKINRAEMLAESSEEYCSYIEKMVESRTQANIAKAEFDAIKMWVDIVRTLESSKRAEMQLR